MSNLDLPHSAYNGRGFPVSTRKNVFQFCITATYLRRIACEVIASVSQSEAKKFDSKNFLTAFYDIPQLIFSFLILVLRGGGQCDSGSGVFLVV